MAKFSFRRESDAPRARRFTELFLLVLAVGISSFGMYLIDPEHAFDTSKSQWLPCTVVLGAGALLFTWSCSSVRVMLIRLFCRWWWL